MVSSIAVFGQRGQVGVAQATFAPTRTVVALRMDLVFVAHGDVELRDAIPAARPRVFVIYIKTISIALFKYLHGLSKQVPGSMPSC